MSKKSFIDSVEVKTPCTEDWEKMHGNDRVRFCDHCAKDVNDLSAVTRKEAMRLVRASGGNLCIRYVQDPVTKRPMFAEQLLQITRRKPALAAGIMTASVSLSTLTYAQGGASTRPANEPAASCPDKAVKSEAAPNRKAQATPVRPAAKNGSVRGTVADTAGAIVSGAGVNLSKSETNLTLSATTNDQGAFEFVGVEPGTYRLVVEATRGFRRYELEDLAVNESLATPVNIVLEPGGYVTMGVMAVRTEYKLPLNRAISDDDVDAVRELISQGEDVNGKDEGKVTPLFLAVHQGDIEIVKMLLDAGAKVNVRDDEKQTPLMRLDDDATSEIIELLLRHGAKVNLTDENNNTALILAAQRAKPEIFKALIDAGADVNVVNKDGQTALMNAANNDSLEGVRMLLEAGAKADLKNNDGETAWDLTSDEEIQDLLVSYGAGAKPRITETTTEPQQEPVPDAN